MISTGKIYKIINRFDNDVYIGSTFNTIKHRFYKHKEHYNDWLNGSNKKCSIYEKFKLYGIENFKIMLIKEYQVYRENKKDRKHLLVYEQLWINKVKCINSICAFNCIPEKERNKQYNKKYKLNNHTKVLESKKKYYESIKYVKITCECGSIINKHGKSKHMKTDKHKQLMNIK
jgi:hypothetical protein